MCLQRSSSFGMSDEILSVLYFQKLNNCDMMSYSIVLVQMSKLEEMFNFYKSSKACANPIMISRDFPPLANILIIMTNTFYVNGNSLQ